MANEKSSNESCGGLRTVTLTNVQWNKLYIYLLTTTNYRKEQISAWEELACKTDPDGSPEYPNAAGNAEYLRELNVTCPRSSRKFANGIGPGFPPGNFMLYFH